MKKASHIKSKLLCIVLCTMVSSLVFADRGGYSGRSSRQARDNFQYRPAGVKNKNFRLDNRYRLNRSYPRHGYMVDRLPIRRPPIRFRSFDYYFHGGIWYRPSGTRFIVIAPPLGIFVPTLPPYYATIWVRGIPYYYANDVYYVWRPDRNGYIVTETPIDPDGPEPPLVADELFIYPMKGQNEQQQADDRYDCHRWSVSQTNYDPTLPPENISAGNLSRKREDYQRAMRACLEGKSYSVR